MLWRVNCITVGIMSAKTAYSREGNILPRLNAVRLFVVVMIAFGYASTMPVGPDKFETGKLFGYEPSWIGIQVLFFLSGALAYRSITAGRIGFEYLKSRVLRTFPMLLAMTLTTVLVIYPMLGKPLTNPQEYIALAKYFFLTVTCIDPGRVLPGLLDDSLYACLIQGGIWTLRWGLIIHIGVAIASRFKVLMQPRLILAAAITSMLIYAAYIYAAIIHRNFANAIFWVYRVVVIHINHAPSRNSKQLAAACAWALRDKLADNTSSATRFSRARQHDASFSLTANISGADRNEPRGFVRAYKPSDRTQVTA